MKRKSVKWLCIVGLFCSVGILASMLGGSQSTGASQQASAKQMDDEKPEILFSNSLELTVAQGKVFDPLDGVKGQDNCDGDITDKIEVTGPASMGKPGSYTFTYTLVDSSGNSAVEDRTYTVNDEAPDKTNDIQTTEPSQAPAVEETDPTESVEITVPTEQQEVQPAGEEAVQQPVVEQPVNESPAVSATISFLGQTIPFIHSNGAAAAPATGAGTWTGTGAVDDQQPTHFIGHNPGDFSDVMSITVGTPITVIDDNGHSKTYTVYEVLDVTDEGINANNAADNAWDRVIEAGGERISLQTCITDTVNRIVLAR